MSDIVNQCRRSALLKLFGEDTGSIVQHCCDVCEHASVSQEANLIKELEILYDAVRTLGSCKRRVKDHAVD